MLLPPPSLLHYLACISPYSLQNKHLYSHVLYFFPLFTHIDFIFSYPQIYFSSLFLPCLASLSFTPSYAFLFPSCCFPFSLVTLLTQILLTFFPYILFPYTSPASCKCLASPRPTLPHLSPFPRPRIPVRLPACTSETRIRCLGEKACCV